MNIPNLRYLSSFRSIATVLASFASFLVLSNPATANVAPATGEIGDFVWKDLNGNGIQDAGEPGIDGVTVYLYSEWGFEDSGWDPAIPRSTVTATVAGQSGYYRFTGLYSFPYYTVEVVGSQPALTGFAPTPPLVGSNTAVDSNASSSIVILYDPVDYSPINDLTIDFGFVRLPGQGKIGDFIWKDTNQNGIQDAGEPGIGGVKVNLKDSTNAVIATTTTDALGGYQFTGLYAGTYSVEVVSSSAPLSPLSGLMPTTSGAGGNLAMDSSDSPVTVTLATDTSVDTSVDFGYIPTPAGSIGDLVWNDINGNGIQDAGELGIGGVVVQLIGPGNLVLATATTDVNGKYLFTNVSAGVYTVLVNLSQPALGGYTATTTGAGTTDTDSNANPAAVSLLLNTSSDLTVDFGFRKPLGIIGNFVWKDMNQDGLQTSGELVVAGVEVRLKNSADSVVATTTTDADGGYQFAGLYAGKYTVEVDTSSGALTGFSATFSGIGSNAAIDSNGSPATVTLVNDNSVDLSIDFGYVPNPAGSIGDFVWYDVNGNGIQDDGSASGIGGIAVQLFDSSSLLLGTTTTASDGFYLFTGLGAGTYVVKVDTAQLALSGYNPTATGVGSASTDSNLNPATVTLPLNTDSDTSIDFGFTKPPGSVGNFVWDDLNNNGVQDSGEPGINGVRVTLYTAAGVQVGTTVTSGGGFYRFDNVVPGDYYVVFNKTTLPANYVFTAQNADSNDSVDSDANVITGKSEGNFKVSSGQYNDTVDAGAYLPKSSLSGFVYNDANNDGIMQSGESGIATTVTLNGTDYLGNTVTLTTTSNASTGAYSFPNLRPGTYAIAETQPLGYLDGKDTIGTRGGSSTNDLFSAISLGAGVDGKDYNFGELNPSSLAGFVYADTNNDGIFQGTESGIGGVTVTLTGTDDLGNAVSLTTTSTAGTGAYSFMNLRPGTYVITETQPGGYLDGTDTIGTPGGIPTDDKFSNVVLAAGVAGANNNFGEILPARLGNFVWNDLNHDGIQTTGEPGISGVVVTLTGPGGTQTATTDVNGFYQFTNLIAGTYTVTVGAGPAGFVSTLTGQGTTATDSNASPATVVLSSGGSDQTIDFGFYLRVIGIDIKKWVHGEYLVQSGGGGEGLTPGFWKNHSIYGPAPLSGWPETGLSPDASYEAIFGVNVLGSETPTLLQALGTGGGGVEALMRHSTAALLNAANPYVDYYYTTAQIISMTQTAINSGNAATIESTKNLFATQNEMGANLSTPATGGTTLVITPDVDADTAPGPVIPLGGTAVFTYYVKSTTNVPLSNIVVTDNTGAPAPVLSGAYNLGDLNHDNLLDPTETWVYRMTETVVSGGLHTNIGTVVGTDSVTGSTATDTDPANYTTTPLGQSLGDLVWLDSNSNGVQDAGEQGIAGVTIQLKDSGGAIQQTTTTDANGNYLFDVAPGNYLVTVLVPSGYGVSPKNLGSDDAKDSDIDPTTKTTDVVSVAAGQQNLTVDAGLYLLSSFSGYVYVDANNDGVKQSSEAPIAGVTVKLTGTNLYGTAVNLTTTTDTSGL